MARYPEVDTWKFKSLHRLLSEKMVVSIAEMAAAKFLLSHRFVQQVLQPIKLFRHTSRSHMRRDDVFFASPLQFDDVSG